MKIYARKEPTTDTLTVENIPKSKVKDTVFYTDKEATKFYARIPWHQSNRPIFRKHVTLNCVKFDIIWI